MRMLIAAVLAFLLAACLTSPQDEPVFEVRALVIEGPPALAEGLRSGSDVQVVPSTRAAALQLVPGTEVKSRPRVLTREGARAEIANSQDVHYAKDARVDPQGVLVPIGGEIEEGLWIAVTPRRADGGRIELECEVRTTDVLRPIGTATVRPEGADRDATIDLPEVDSHRWAGRVELAPSQSVTIVFGAPPRGDQRRVRVVVIACDPARIPEGA